MKLDDLKQNWQKAIKTESAPENIDEVIKMLEQETKKLDKEIKRRDFVEILICVFLMPVWVYGIMTSVSTMQTIGCITAILTGLLIPYRLLLARKIDVKKTDGMKDFLKQEKQKLLNQKLMLESIVWWYIAPITISILLITLGSNINEQGLPVIPDNMYWYYASVALLVVGIYFMNKREAKKRFGPLLEKVEQRLADIG